MPGEKKVPGMQHPSIPHPFWQKKSKKISVFSVNSIRCGGYSWSCFGAGGGGGKILKIKNLDPLLLHKGPLLVPFLQYLGPLENVEQ